MKLSHSSIITKRALLVIFAVLLAALLRLWPLDVLGNRFPYTTFYPAVMLSSVYGGFYFGLVSAFLSTLLFYFRPFSPPFIQDSADLLGLLVFFVNSLIFSIIGYFSKKTHRKMIEAMFLSHRLAAALDNISAYIFVKDLNSRYIYGNKKTLELFNCTLDELQGRKDEDFFPEETVEYLRQIDSRVLKGHSTAEEVISKGENGENTIYWEVKAPIYKPTTGRIWGLCGISTDITERKKREDALRETEERFRSLFDSAAIGMSLVSLDGRFLQPNRSLCRMLGYTEHELVQKRFQEITHPDDLELDLELMRELLNGKRVNYQIEKRYFDKNGQIIWILLSGAVVHDAKHQIKYFVAQMIDITERIELLNQLEQQAHQDYLTGLYNRRFFIAQGEREVSLAQRYKLNLALLMIDIDHFKRINDTYGHKVGDIVLKNLSMLLKSKLRTVDIIGRLGGEEFAIILPKSDEFEAAHTAERIRKFIIDTPVQLEEHTIPYTISIGVALLNEVNKSIDQLLIQADAALYRAKHDGRNKVCLATEL